jgi:O-glycosyl hydrolase
MLRRLPEDRNNEASSMNTRPLRLAAASLSLLAACVFLAGPAEADSSVSIDFGAAHNFTGIGTQIQLKAGRCQDEAQLLRDMNAQFVRVSIIPAIRENVPTGQSVEQYSQLLQSLIPPRLANNTAALRTVLEQTHIKPHIVFWHMPDSWEEAVVKKAGKKKEAHKAEDARIPDWANLLTAQILWITKQGIEPYAVELTNEPQGGWDTKYTPEQYADLVLATRRSLDAHGLQRIRIEGPGTGVRNFPEFMQGLRAKGAQSQLAFITAHAYQTPQAMDDPRTAGYSEFLGHGQYGEIVMTEFGVKKHNAEDVEAASADIDVGSHEYGLATGAESLKLLGKGASSVIYWELSDVENNPKKHGALDASCRRRPVAYALQALFGKVGAPSRTVAGIGGSPDVPVEGFSANGRVWLLMANMTDSPQKVSARIAGAAPHGVAGVDGFSNGALSNNALTGAAVTGSTFSGTLAPRALASVALQ